MKFKKRFLLFFTVFCLLLTSCANLSIPTNADAAFENFTLTLFQQDVSSTTLGLHYTLQNPENYGIDNHTITFGAFNTSKEEALAALENCQALLSKFSYKSLSKENQITYDVLSYYLETSIEGASYLLFEEPLSPLTDRKSVV